MTAGNCTAGEALDAVASGFTHCEDGAAALDRSTDELGGHSGNRSAKAKPCWDRNRRCAGYLHTVPGARKTSRVSCLVWLTVVGGVPRVTVYSNVASFPSRNVSVMVPTGVRTTSPGLKGVALNAGPVCVRYRIPLKTWVPILGAVAASHSGAPSKS